MPRTPRSPGRDRRSIAWIVFVAALLALTACGQAEADDGSEPGTRDRELVVFAAASLTDAFGTLAERFEDANPRVEVRLNTAGSSALATQVEEGAGADVFASANEAVMDRLVDGDLVAGSPRAFAVNRLTIAVPTGNPAGISGPGDFGRTELFIGLCAAGVPCGDLADAVLAAAGVRAEPDTRAGDVRALLTKIAARELDAGLVYRTDVLADDAVDAVPLDASLPAAASYPIAALRDAPSPDLADRFVAFVRSPDGQAVLADHGFGAP